MRPAEGDVGQRRGAEQRQVGEAALLAGAAQLTTVWRALGLLLDRRARATAGRRRGLRVADRGR